MTNKKSSPSPFQILLVEDNEDDVLITMHAFQNLPVAVDFHVARDGLEALQFLKREPPYGGAPLPHVILLDLNMPRMDGRQLLAQLKQDEHLQFIPTVILTTSSAEDDVCGAYRSHASAYMTKPMDMQEFTRRTQCFSDFWLSGAILLPPAPSSTRLVSPMRAT